MEAGSGNPTLTLTYAVTSLGREDWKTYHDYSGAEVDLQTGNLMVENTDVAIPGRGMGTTISRTYNSQDASSSVFGPGWRTYPDSVRITSDTSSAALYTDSGAVHVYLKSGSAYIRPPGVTDDLTKNPDGTFVLKHKDQGKTNFDSAGRISSEVDRNGNTVTFSYGANGHIQNITDPSGRRTTVSYSAQNTVSQISDFAGRTVSYGYDGSGRLATFTNQATQTAETVTYTYNASGVLSGVTDPEQHSTTVSYDAEKRATGVSNPLGNTMAVSYNTQNVPDETDTPQKEASKTTVTDPRGGQFKYHFTPDGLLTKQVDPIGPSPDPTTDETNFPHDEEVEDVTLEEYAEFTADMTAEGLPPQELSTEASWTAATKYEYDADYNVTKETDKNGSVTTHTFDSRANELTTTDPNGTTHYHYDSSSNLLSETSPAGNVRLNTYDAKGNMTCFTDPEGGRTTYTYDPYGNRVTEVKPRGNETAAVSSHYTTTSSYDVNGNLVSTVDPMGVIAQYAYDSLGQKISEQTEGLEATRYVYDAVGRIVRHISPSVSLGGSSMHTETRHTYDRAGNNTVEKSIEVTDGAEVEKNRQEFSYDAANRRISQSSFANDRSGAQTTTYTYDEGGNRIAESSPSGGVTTYEYDAMGRLVKQTEPDGNFTANKYDGQGNTVKIGNPRGTDVVVFGEHGKDVAIAGADGAVSKLYYDEEGNDIRVADPADEITKNSYDSGPNLVSVTDAESHTTTFDYDANGNEVKVTSTAGTTATTVYNRADQVSQEIDQNRRASTLSYNPSGLASDVDVPNRQDSDMSYDAAGKLVAVDATASASLSDVNTTYSAFGAPLATTTMTDAAQGPITELEKTYNSDNRIASITDLSGVTVSFVYDTSNGRFYRVSDPSGYTTYTYDTSDKLTVVTDPNNFQTALSYDAAGSLTKTSLPNGVDQKASYDEASKVTHVWATQGAGTLSDFRYAYDVGGNATSTGVYNTVTHEFETSSYSYDSIDRLTQVTRADSSTVAYTYDSQGNRLTKHDPSGTASYSYTPANELTRVASPSGTTTFTHDENGNTATKHDSSGTTSYSYDNNNQLVRAVKPSGTVVEYTYDGDGNRYRKKVGSVVTYYHYDDQGNVLSETDGTGAVKVRYVRDTAGKTISMIEGAHTYYPIYNARGDVVALTDEYAAVVARYSYDEFGNTTSETGAVYNPLRYAAAYNSYYDSETGLYKMGARYYDPSVGRWTTRDPCPGFQREPATLNKYVYVKNNPLRFADPTGMWTSEFHVKLSASACRSRGFARYRDLQVAYWCKRADTKKGADACYGTNMNYHWPLALQSAGDDYDRDGLGDWYEVHLKEHKYKGGVPFVGTERTWTLHLNAANTNDRNRFKNLGLALHCTQDKWAHKHIVDHLNNRQVTPSAGGHRNPETGLIWKEDYPYAPTNLEYRKAAESATANTINKYTGDRRTPYAISTARYNYLYRGGAW